MGFDVISLFGLVLAWLGLPISLSHIWVFICLFNHMTLLHLHTTGRWRIKPSFKHFLPGSDNLIMSFPFHWWEQVTGPRLIRRGLGGVAPACLEIKEEMLETPLTEVGSEWLSTESFPSLLPTLHSVWLCWHGRHFILRPWPPMHPSFSSFLYQESHCRADSTFWESPSSGLPC